MPQAVSSTPRASRYQQVCSAEHVSTFTATEIREAISYWVAGDRLDIADALVTAGMNLHPGSQDILAVGALMAEVQQDWAQAQDRLERLLQSQGSEATAETYFHLVRVKRCRAAYFSAWRLAQAALLLHPAHAGLQQEFDELSTLLSDDPATAQVTTPALAS